MSRARKNKRAAGKPAARREQGTPMQAERSDSDKAKIRFASILIVVSMLAWVAISLLGGKFGWPERYAFLLDMLCLAALGWALVTLILVWRKGAGKE